MTPSLPAATAHFSGPARLGQHAFLLVSVTSSLCLPGPVNCAPCGLIEPVDSPAERPPLQRQIPLASSVATALIAALFSGCSTKLPAGVPPTFRAPWPRQTTPPRKQRLPPPPSPTLTCPPQDLQRRVQPLSRPTRGRDSTLRLTPALSNEIPTTSTIPWLLQNLFCHTNPLLHITSWTVTLRRKLCVQKNKLRL